jgi:hypothetical protein
MRLIFFFKGNYALPSRDQNGSPIPTGKFGPSTTEEKKKLIPIRTSSAEYYGQQNSREREQLQQQLQHRDYMENEKGKEREKERERLHREREREKAAAQVSSKKKVEQRISTMSEAQIMEKLSKFIFTLVH